MLSLARSPCTLRHSLHNSSLSSCTTSSNSYSLLPCHSSSASRLQPSFQSSFLPRLRSLATMTNSGKIESIFLLLLFSLSLYLFLPSIRTEFLLGRAYLNLLDLISLSKSILFNSSFPSSLSNLQSCQKELELLISFPSLLFYYFLLPPSLPPSLPPIFYFLLSFRLRCGDHWWRAWRLCRCY